MHGPLNAKLNNRHSQHMMIKVTLQLLCYMWVDGQCHALVTLLPGKRPGTNCTGGSVVPRVGMDRYRKFCPHRDLSPQQVTVPTMLLQPPYM